MRTLVVLVIALALLFPSRAQAEDAARGEKLLAKKGCLACHSTDGSAKVGPSFRGLWGGARKVETGGATREVVADGAYVARSLREPYADVVVGFPRGNMPRFDLGDDDLRDVSAALKAMSGAPVEGAGRSSSMLPFAASVAGFVGFHLLLSAVPVRKRLIGALNARGFSILYSLVAFAFFFGIVACFKSAPYVEVWVPPRWTRWIPVLTMPVALFFLVAGFSTPGPTTVAQGARAKEPPKGIQAVTRHPALWGFALWALAHLATNGELHVIILAGGFLLLSVAGMRHIDARRAHELGDAWTGFAEQSSTLPFAAIARGKARLRLREIGLVRVVVAAVLYVGMLHAHGLVVGASPYP